MATPRNDSYSAASGADIYFGMTAPVTLPAWVGASGQWSTLPNSTLSTSGAGWAGTSPGGFGNFNQIMLAWGGGWLNTVGVKRGGVFRAGTSFGVHGGGHTNYGGNENMDYGRLEDDSPTWARITDPTIPAPQNVARDGSGNPASTHPYDGLHFLPTLNKMIRMGASGLFDGGGDSLACDLADFATNTWAAGPNLPNVGSAGLYDRQGDYNPTTNKVWVVGIGNATYLWCYDVATAAISQYGINNPNYLAHCKGAIEPNRNLLVTFTASGGLQAINLAAISDPVALTVTGTGPSGGTKCLDWDATNQRFVAWSPSDGNRVFFLAPAAIGGTWVWTSVAGTGGASPSTNTGNGVYSRMQVVASPVPGVALFSDPTAPGCFFRF